MEKQQAASMFPGSSLKRGLKSTNNFFTDATDSTATSSLPHEPSALSTPSGKSESVMDQIAAISKAEKK
jgi:hypothetical protein